MSVQVIVMPASLPDEARAEGVSREIRHDDIVRDGVAEVRYEYTIHPSGALRIWRFSEGSERVDVAYGPAAWHSVQGSPRDS